MSAAPGYALRLSTGDVDAWRFDQLVADSAQAQAEGDPSLVERLAEEALALWRGPAYAEFADEPWARPEAARLDELRMVAMEYRADAALQLGQAARVVPDLERHVHAHPLREEAVRLLALALYRSGRQADALATLRRARERLADELGVDPGPALRALESDVLRQAVHLDRPAQPPSVPAAGREPAAAPSRAGASARPAERPGGATLVGRNAELTRLTDTAERVCTEGFQVVWLGGEAGVGKTALAEAFTRQLGWTAT